MPASTRAARLKLPHGARVFAIDVPEVLAAKASRLGDDAPACEVPVPADLATDTSWPSRLQNAGFEPSKPAVFVLEGLLHYLEEADSLRLLDVVATLGAPGSRLVLDLLNFAPTARGRKVLDSFGVSFKYYPPEDAFTDELRSRGFKCDAPTASLVDLLRKSSSPATSFGLRAFAGLVSLCFRATGACRCGRRENAYLFYAATKQQP